MQCDKLIVGIGNRLRSDDAAGSIVARRLAQAGFCSIDTESMPENYIGTIQRRKPKTLVIVDACDMNLPAGEVRRIDLSALYGGIITTHGLPVHFLLQKLQEITPHITFIGIQPETIAIGDKVSVPMHHGIDYCVAMLVNDKETDIPLL